MKNTAKRPLRKKNGGQITCDVIDFYIEFTKLLDKASTNTLHF